VRVESTPGAVDEFYRLNCLTGASTGCRRSRTIFSRSCTGGHFQREWVRISGLLPGKSHCRNVYFHFGRQAIYKYGASDKNGRACGPATWSCGKRSNGSAGRASRVSASADRAGKRRPPPVQKRVGTKSTGSIIIGTTCAKAPSSPARSKASPNTPPSSGPPPPRPERNRSLLYKHMDKRPGIRIQERRRSRTQGPGKGNTNEFETWSVEALKAIKHPLGYDLSEGKPADQTVDAIIAETSGLYKDLDPEREAKDLRTEWERKIR